ncbi:MAG: multicopper oxidase family protein [Gammaproteobacteria bacterium]|nr:multicopper oxidase family protein [Gammaproteobacteria bacterium]
MNRRNFIKATAYGLSGGVYLKSLPAYSTLTRPPFHLTASPGGYKFAAKQESATRVMFYNQSIPGPVIRIPQGKESIIELSNQLDQPTSIHWHGLRIENAMDGVPGMTQELIQPGASYTYSITPPDAGTYWYHTHQRAWEQLAFGLAGVLIVEEEQPPLVDQDLVFAIDDWKLNKSMQIDKNSLGNLHEWAHGGRIGNIVTVNGKINKEYSVARGERIRLRLLNIANARVMTLRVNQPDTSIISIDGQPVKPFRLSNGIITLAPGQRSDLMIDMTSEPGHISPVELMLNGQAYEVAQFKFNAAPKRERIMDSGIALPANPATNVVLPKEFQHIPLSVEGGAMGRMKSATYQGKEMGINELVQNKQIWAFNGVAGLANKPLFKVKRGTAISLDIENKNSWPHGLHVHGHHFIDDRQPDFWRDTALFTRQEKSSLTFVADNPGKWLIHCHMIEHQAGGMVTWFEVI